MPQARTGNGKKVHAILTRQDGTPTGYTYCDSGFWLKYDRITEDPVTCKLCLAEMARQEAEKHRKSDAV